MFSPEVYDTLDRYISGSIENDTSLLLGNDEVLSRISSLADHASEVMLIIHALTVEVRDFREKTISVFYLSEIEHVLYSQFAFEGYRRMFAVFMHCYDRVMVHSSAVLRNGRVILLVAPDEGGKTTAALLEPSGRILCDDRNVLACGNGGTEVYGTPWGSHSTPGLSGPLGGIFLLQKTSSFSVTPLSQRDAALFMWHDNRHFWNQLPVDHRTGVLDLLLAACRSVPVGMLSFPRDHIDWEAVDRFLESS